MQWFVSIDMYKECYKINTICKLDIDECFEALDVCSSNAACINIDGGYNCSCDTGYNGDGFLCFSMLT